MNNTEIEELYDNSSEDGFSLIEVLVSFAILTLTLAMLMEVFSGGTWRFSSSRESDEMLVIARNKLANIKVNESMVDGKNLAGSNDKYYWKIRFIPIPYSVSKTPNAGKLYKVIVIVFSKRKTSKFVKLDSFITKTNGQSIDE